MGCYLSTPDDKVYIAEGKGKNFLHVSASCQGWRREQEDAEECIPYYDDDASLFVLCDGHGGAEVANYTVKHFPEFLKNHPLYKEGKYEQALEKAFIDFDALLWTDNVIDELNKDTNELVDEDEEDSEFKGEEESDSDNQDEDDDGDDERDEEASGEKSKSKRLRHKRYKRPTSGPNIGSSSKDESEDNGGEEEENIDDEEEDDDDDDDADDDDDDDDDDDNDEEEDDDEDDDDDDDADDDDDDEEEDEENQRKADAEHDPNAIHYDLDGINCLKRINQNLKAASRVHRPGIDSGCTVVVALVKNNKLYVASAGDSRCIVIMRDGQCKPMSFDHKPEDKIELTRIQKAGGRVTEGRVNGGLNLSRAFGDFTYKDWKLAAKDQMITPCPDVKTIDLDPSQVEYVFLACDGIWNSMRNQQVTRFIRRVAPTVNNDLTEICLKLFRECIAPGTDGDGTGCDNMTCILIKYDNPSEIEQIGTRETNQLETKKDDAALSNQNEDGAQSTTTSENNDSLDKQQLSANQSNKRSAVDDDESNDTTNKSAHKKRCIRLPPIK